MWFTWEDVPVAVAVAGKARSSVAVGRILGRRDAGRQAFLVRDELVGSVKVGRAAWIHEALAQT